MATGMRPCEPVSTSSVYQCVGQLCDLGLGEVLCHAAHASWIFGVLLRLPEAVWSLSADYVRGRHRLLSASP